MPLKNPTITKEQAKEELLKVKNKLEKVPYKKEFFKHRTLTGCHNKAIEFLFGPNAWNNFLLYSGLEVNISSPQKPQKVKCLNCKTEFVKQYSEIQKTENHFCSYSCSASFNNTHKTTGTRRSKLEIYIQQELEQKFSNLEILFNDKTAINSELDIYIPALKLAFELNGIFHYEPIFGDDKLEKIQNNDLNKFQLCQQNNISLCIIDTSSQKSFTELSSQKFLKIITEIITYHTKIE